MSSDRYQSLSDVRQYFQAEEWLAPLLATAEGRYDFVVPAYLNAVYPDIQVTRFQDWFLRNWASIP